MLFKKLVFFHISFLFFQFEFRERADDLHRFERDGDDAQQQVVDVFRVVVLAAPVVRIVLNPARRVRLHRIALHHPLDCRLAVHHVVVGLQRNVLNRDARIVMDYALVGRLAVQLAEAHLIIYEVADLVAAVRQRRVYGAASGVGLHTLVSEVEFGQAAAGTAEGPEVVGRLDQRQSGQRLLEVGGEGRAVVRGVEDAVDIIEDVLLGYAASVLLAGRGEDPVGHAVAADVAVCIALRGREEVGNIRRAVIIPIERETLTSTIICIIVYDIFCYIY